MVWLGSVNKMPEDWIDSFKRLYDDYEFMLWTEDNLFELKNQDIFDKEIRNHTKSNIVRYEVLYKYGGIYFDCDKKALKKIPDSFLEDDFFVSYENEHHKPGLISTTPIGAKKGHPLLKKLIDGIKDRNQFEVSWRFCGPGYLTETLEGADVKIYPSYYFHPYYFRDGKHVNQERVNRAYTYHFWGTSVGKFKTSKDFRKDLKEKNQVDSKRKYTLNDISFNIMIHPQRKEYLPYLKEKLGGVAAIWDRKNNVWDTRRRALKHHLKRNKKWCLTVQDDCILTDNFKQKVVDFINFIGNDDAVYNFYAQKGIISKADFAKAVDKGYFTKDDLTNEPAFAFPTEYIPEIIKELDNWPGIHKEAGGDGGMRRFFIERGIKTYFCVPSLVDHRQVKSIFKFEKLSEKERSKLTEDEMRKRDIIPTDRYAWWFIDNKEKKALDVVYPVKEKNWEELKYSLRSLKHTNHENVFIVGDLPDYVNKDSVIHVPMDDLDDPTLSVVNKIKKVIEDPRLSDNFILMNDDFYFLEDQEIKHYNNGELKRHADKRNDMYGRMYRNAARILKKSFKIRNPLSYELHYPLLINKKSFIRIFNRVRIEDTVWRSIYGNAAKLKSEKPDIKTLNEIKDFKFYNRKDFDIMKENKFISSPSTVPSEFKKFIQKKFPQKSIYEK